MTTHYGAAEIAEFVLSASSRLRDDTRAAALPGSPEDPLTEEDTQAKWPDCLLRGLDAVSEKRAIQLFQEGLGFDALPGAGKWLVGLAD